MLASRHGVRTALKSADYADVDFFGDPRLVADPYPCYDSLRAQCPVSLIPRSGVVAVTGYDELTEVYRDNATYSSVNSSLGPFPLPFSKHRDRIPNFVEQMLPLESPIKSDFRLARVATTLGGVDIPAGTALMLPGAANRDPSHFACPAELRIDRPNARHNVAFARGVHSCPGGPLARIEGRVTIERILDRLNDIRLDEAQRGTADARRLHYVPLYIIRGLQELHLEFTAAS
jgi:cytochrome P450